MEIQHALHTTLAMPRNIRPVFIMTMLAHVEEAMLAHVGEAQRMQNESIVHKLPTTWQASTTCEPGEHHA